MHLKIVAGISALFMASGASAADRYSVSDEGGFGATGRHIEFSSRYGWESYAIDYDFGLEMAERRIDRKSSLRLTIRRNDGSSWSYRCRAKDTREMWANINLLYGKGVSVMTECRIDPAKFAKAVGLDADLVGEPTLVFHVMIKEGKAVSGIQKGFYFLAGGQIEASPLSQYATKYDDPSELAVLFASAMAPYQQHPGTLRRPVFVH